jgi:hypothetical protein
VSNPIPSNPNPPLLSGELKLEAARDVLRLLESQVVAVLGDGSLTVGERSRIIVPLANGALRAVEAGELAARVEALERTCEDGRHELERQGAGVTLEGVPRLSRLTNGITASASQSLTEVWDIAVRVFEMLGGRRVPFLACPASRHRCARGGRTLGRRRP